MVCKVFTMFCSCLYGPEAVMLPEEDAGRPKWFFFLLWLFHKICQQILQQCYWYPYIYHLLTATHSKMLLRSSTDDNRDTHGMPDLDFWDTKTLSWPISMFDWYYSFSWRWGYSCCYEVDNITCSPLNFQHRFRTTLLNSISVDSSNNSR